MINITKLSEDYGRVSETKKPGNDGYSGVIPIYFYVGTNLCDRYNDLVLNDSSNYFYY
jgi:hypothetical protein